MRATFPILVPAGGLTAAMPRALRYGIAVGSPLLLTIAFPNADFGIAAFVALAPNFWLWSRSSWKEAAWLGWLSGTVFFCI
ncbi:MAG TPA: hypothetical protein VEJ20_04505, partial [Candidatus Eremiobacteraceae bacterium]|nr:hypothetical protein [Candidatus Eremiobacteraceae bacterium]